MPKVKAQDLRSIGFVPGAGNGWYLDYGPKTDQTHLHLRVDGSEWGGGYDIAGITVKINDQQAGQIGYSVLSKSFSTWTLQAITGNADAVALFTRAIERLNESLVK